MDLDTTRRGRNLLTAALIAAALTIAGTVTAAASHGPTPPQAAAGDCLGVHHGGASDAEVDVVS